MLDPEDRRLGALLREIRRRARVSQSAVAVSAGVPRRDVVLVEAGRAGEVRLARVRRIFAIVGGRVRTVGEWRGAEGDRLLDGRHASLVERVVRVLLARGWDTRTEVSFSRYGERGSVDILGGRRALSTAVVVEVKGSIGSLEEMIRRLDVKARLAPEIVAAELGWRPRTVGRILVLPEGMTERRVVERHRATLGTAYPARSREVRSWLRRPDAPLRGLWFLSDDRDTRTGDGEKPRLPSSARGAAG